MKNLILFLALILICSSCSKDQDNFINVNGKIIYKTGKGAVGGAKLLVSTIQFYSSGTKWSYHKDVDSIIIFTDANGNFNVNLKYDKGDDTLIQINVSESDIYTSPGTIGYKLNQNNNISIELSKLEKVKIFIRNTSPFNSNDTVGFYFSQWLGKVNLINIQNFGNQNQTYVSQPGIIVNETYWKGTSVNSIINYTVLENKSCNISWNFTKNGISTEKHLEIPIVSNEINEFHIDY